MLRLSTCEYSFCSIDSGPFNAEQVIDIMHDIFNIQNHRYAPLRYHYMYNCLVQNEICKRGLLLC